MERGQWCFASFTPTHPEKTMKQLLRLSTEDKTHERLNSGRCDIHAQVYTCHQAWGFWEHRKLDIQWFSSPFGPFQAYYLLPVLPYLLLTSLQFSPFWDPKGLQATANQMHCFPKYERAWHKQAAGHQDSTSDTQDPATAVMQRSKQNYSLPSGEGCQSCLTSDLDRARSKNSVSLAPRAHAGTTKQWSQETRTSHP